MIIFYIKNIIRQVYKTPGTREPHADEEDEHEEDDKEKRKDDKGESHGSPADEP